MYQMTLFEWQKTPKRRDQLLYNCSIQDGSDAWIPFSIGMGYQILNYNGPIEDIQKGPHNNQVLCAINPYSDRHRRPNGKNRLSIIHTLENKGINNNNNMRMTIDDYLHLLPRFQFVISPEGNGIDCHRHYEALMAGCIPIVERDDRLLEKYGNCPILFTDDYSEITSDYLSEKYLEMLHKTWDFSRLCLDTYDSETQAQIKANGNYWAKKFVGREWYI
jgi:hypothetical protein